MAVNIHRDVNRAMSKLALDILGMFPLGDKQASVGVSQVVESDARQTSSA